MKPLQILNTLFLGLVILLTGSPSWGQKKIDIAAGVGFPELLTLELRYQLEQSQVGLYGGSVPGGSDKSLSFGVDYYYHFGGSSNFSTRRPWFAKAGLNYLFEEDLYDKTTYLLLVPRAGRDFNISRRIGISLEGGLYFVLAHFEVEIQPGENPGWFSGTGWFPDVAPSFSFNVFYRL